MSHSTYFASIAILLALLVALGIYTLVYVDAVQVSGPVVVQEVR